MPRVFACLREVSLRHRVSSPRDAVNLRTVGGAFPTCGKSLDPGSVLVKCLLTPTCLRDATGLRGECVFRRSRDTSSLGMCLLTVQGCLRPEPLCLQNVSSVCGQNVSLQ